MQECTIVGSRRGNPFDGGWTLGVTLVGAMCGSGVEFNNVNLASERWAFVWD
jgi:hypothetical protein